MAILRPVANRNIRLHKHCDWLPECRSTWRQSLPVSHCYCESLLCWGSLVCSPEEHGYAENGWQACLRTASVFTWRQFYAHRRIAGVFTMWTLHEDRWHAHLRTANPQYDTFNGWISFAFSGNYVNQFANSPFCTIGITRRLPAERRPLRITGNDASYA